MPGLKKFFKDNKIVLFLFFLSLVTKLALSSPWLEDWDSVQFALGLHDFDIVKHQPHPPGYPLYILVGKISYFFFNNDAIALSFLSNLSGSLSLVVFYLLVKKMFGSYTAIIAAAFLALLPVHWIISEVPISNMPGFFFLVLLTYLTYTDVENRTEKTYLGFIAGIALGVRATDFPIVAGLLIFSVLKRRNFIYLIYVAGGFLAGVSLWLISLIKLTGLPEFLAANAETRRYVIWHDVLFGKAFSLPVYLQDRIVNSIKLLGIGFGPVFLIFSLGAVFLNFIKKGFWQSTKNQLLAVYLLSYGLFFIFFYNLELAQYTLPLALGFATVAAVTLTELKVKKISKILLFFFIIYLFIRTYSQVSYQHSAIPPTIEPVFYVKENFKPKETLLITTFTFRQFQYYASEYQNYYGVVSAPKEITAEFVIVDYRELPKQIPALSGYTIIDEKSFGLNENPFARLKTTNLFVLKKNKTSLNVKPYTKEGGEPRAY